MGESLLRIIDVNINRASEGIRVCEDLCRFVYNHTPLAARLKHLRHQILEAASIYKGAQLVEARNVAHDTLKFADEKRETQRSSLLQLAQANIHRATEALRSLEEYTKLVTTEDTYRAGVFQEIRFALYAVEQELCVLIQKKDLCGRFAGALYVWLDLAVLGGQKSLLLADQLLQHGVRIIEVITRSLSSGEAYPLVQEIATLCTARDALLVVQGSADIALAVAADAIRLDSEDLPLRAVTRMLPQTMLIGMTVCDSSRIKEAAVAGIDFLVVGPLFSDKHFSREKEVSMFNEHCRSLELPVVVHAETAQPLPDALKELNYTAIGVDAVAYLDDGLEELVTGLRTLIDREKGDNAEK
jgi:thiamine-phosphate pyrophosphorylase